MTPWKKIVHFVDKLHLHAWDVKFDWGVDSFDSKEKGSPEEILKKIASNAVAHGDDFFSFKVPSDFKLEENMLSFTSPAVYQGQHEKNKTAYAKVFPAKNSKGRAVVVVPFWRAGSKSFISLCKALPFFGITAVRLTLPYHEERGTDKNWKYGNDLVSGNIGLTIQAVRQAVIDVRAIIYWLKENGYPRIGLFGSSIGSCIAFLASVHEPSVKSVFGIHMSSFFGDVVWRGISTKHIQQCLEPHTTLSDLHNFWSVISPFCYVKNLKGRDSKHSFIVGTYDLTFPYDLTEKVFEEYDRHHIPYSKKVLPVGHFTLRYGPFKYWMFALILKHFKSTL